MREKGEKGIILERMRNEGGINEVELRKRRIMEVKKEEN